MSRLVFPLCFLFTATSLIWSDESNWETLQVVPYVSGLRVESLPGDKGFIGYTDAWELIVEPDTMVTVAVFGYWLDKVEYVTFTDSICLTSEFNISQSEFTLQTERKLEFKLSFPNWENPWRMCIKQKGRLGELLLIDDDRTWITTSETRKEHFLPFYIQVIVLSALFILSALFSGLNLGLMSLSTQELSLIIKSGSEKEAQYAKMILPIRQRGNYLLCTILIMNVVVNASISILFEDLTSGTISFIISSLGIVVFGEIMPQSICVKHGLAVGARTILLTQLFMWLTFPLSWPISKVLDLIIGEEVDQFDRGRLVEILKMNTEGDENLELAADLKIAVGAMEFAHKVASSVMTRIDDVYMLSENAILDTSTIAEIVNRGYTRIPIYEDNDRNKVKSLLLVKDLALIDKKNNIKVKAVSEFHERQLRIVDEDTPLPELLEEFKRGNYHLAMVAKSPTKREASFLDKKQNSTIATLDSRHSIYSINANPDINEPLLLGLVTLEDLLEEILQSEIIDESDSVMDNVQRSRRKVCQSRISELFCCETRSEPLSLNMLEVVCKWLIEYHPLFDDNNLEKKARERMVQRNIRHVILVPKNKADSKCVKLYENGVPSKRFILVLEGKAIAKFNKSEMSFDIGPWTCFGAVLLQKLTHIINNHQDLQTNIYFVPDFDLIVQQPCRFLQIPISGLIHALRISQFVKQMRTPTISLSDEDDQIPLLMGRRTNRENVRSRNRSIFLDSDSSHITDSRLRSLSTAPGLQSPPTIVIEAAPE